MKIANTHQCVQTLNDFGKEDRKRMTRKMEKLKSQLNNLECSDKLIKNKCQDAKKFMSAPNVYTQSNKMECIDAQKETLKKQIKELQEQI